MQNKNKNKRKSPKSFQNIHKLNNEKIHNERGAGRKEKFTKEQKEQIKRLRADGKTIKEIAEIFKCSAGLIHKLISE